MPKEVYSEVKKRKRTSVTAYVVEAVEEKLARDKEEEIREGLLSLVGSVDRDEIEPFLEAQRRAFAKGDD